VNHALYACIMAALLVADATWATSLQDCDADMTGVELVTGYVFTAPDDLLDSIPGTLMLTDCLEACHGNDTCYSVNYETGLCVMFSSNADSYPGNNICSRKSKGEGITSSPRGVLFKGPISRSQLFSGGGICIIKKL